LSLCIEFRSRPVSRHAKKSPDDVNEENMVLSGLPTNCSNAAVAQSAGGGAQKRKNLPLDTLLPVIKL